MSEMIQVQMDGRTARVTLNRPPLNVLDIAMMRELDAALARVATECDLLVLQGAGPKGFSAGAEVADHVPERVGEMLGAFHGVFRRLARVECVTIAAVSGLCLGGGMELATFCDFVVATEAAKFGQPEIKLACYPPVAMVTFPLLRHARRDGPDLHGPHGGRARGAPHGSGDAPGSRRRARSQRGEIAR